MTIEELLFEEIEKLKDELDEAEPGSKEYEAKANRLDRLMSQAIEIGKFNVEHEDKQALMNEDKKDRLVKNLLSAAGIVLPIIVTVWGTKASFKFEQEGTVTTIMGRGFINKLLPKK